MVIMKVGHHLYDGHHLFGTKQQRTLGPSCNEQYLGFSSARWMVRRSAIGHQVAKRCSLRRCGQSAALGQTVRDPVVGAGLLSALSRRSTLWDGWSATTQGHHLLLVGPRPRP
jgi:hypothetical protein